MLGFDWKPIRERDEDGRLLAAGLQWTEMRKGAFGTIITIANLSLMGSMAGCVHQQMFRDSNGGLVALWLLGVCVVCVVAARLAPGRMRALVFHEDGRTSAPYGFAHYSSKYREVYGSNAEFVSIEARSHGPQSSDADVLAYSRTGGVTYVAGHLHRDNAHMVAVQLTLALAELRESFGNERRDGSAEGSQRRAEALID
jgi:hypothetical protein